jgi:dihydrofolate reductase
MRKLRLQMQVTIDGFNSTAPNDEQTWVTWDLAGLTPHVVDLLDSSDTILLGRKLGVDYIPFWEGVSQNPDHPMHVFATRIVAARKVIFTKTLDESRWERTTLARGDLKDEVNRLKNQPGKDLIVYGGSSFVASLIREDLIDEYHLFINPIAIGQGENTFAQLMNWQWMKLVTTRVYDSGIVLLVYQPRRDSDA